MITVEPKVSTRILLKNVLFATDFSSAAHAALPYALAIARHYASTLHVVHVVPELDILIRPDPAGSMNYESIFAEESRIALEKIRDLIPELENMPHQAHVCRGKTWTALSDVIRRQRIDLLVTGTHGRSGLGKLLMGSVAEELLRQAPCPVLTVGPKAGGRTKEEFDQSGRKRRTAEIEIKQIIFATDFSPESLEAVPLAISLADEFRARLGLVHVIDPHRPIPSQLVLHRLRAVVPEEAELWCTTEVIVKCGVPEEEILEAAAEHNADLIVLGARSAKAHLVSATHFPWSTAHRIVVGANCPVLTVRS